MSERRERPIKWYEQLQGAKHRKKEGRCLVEGPRGVEQLIANASHTVEELLYVEGYIPLEDVPSRRISSEQMQKVTSTVTPTSVVAVCKIPEGYRSDTLPSSTGAKILFLEDVQDPGNMGALIRSAVAFGFEGLIVTAGCADPYAPKVIRSTGGAFSELWIRRTQTPYALLSTLKRDGFSLVCADLGGEGYLPSLKKVVVALGNEGNGVSGKLNSLSDVIYTIPFESLKIESLNVAIAGSIVMASLYNLK